MIEIGKKYRLTADSIKARLPEGNEALMPTIFGYVQDGTLEKGTIITVTRVSTMNLDNKTLTVIWYDDNYFLVFPRLEPVDEIDFPWGRLVLLILVIVLAILLFNGFKIM